MGRRRYRSFCAQSRVALRCAAVVIGWLSVCSAAQARTWSFEDASTGLSPLSALSGSPVTLDGDFDYIFNSGVSLFQISDLNIVLGNTAIGTFSNFSVANITTTVPDRVFNIDGFSGVFQFTLSFTVREDVPSNSLSDSNPTGTAHVADRAGGFIGGVSIPPHDVLLTTTEYLGGGMTASTSVAFGNVLLVDPDHSVVPLPPAVWLFGSAIGALLFGRRSS